LFLTGNSLHCLPLCILTLHSISSQAEICHSNINENTLSKEQKHSEVNVQKYTPSPRYHTVICAAPVSKQFLHEETAHIAKFSKSFSHVKKIHPTGQKEARETNGKLLDAIRAEQVNKLPNSLTAT
jgi:hypothetical protein